MNWDAIFPKGSHVTEKTTRYTVYTVDFPDGSGTMTAHRVLPGILLVFNDFYTRCGFRNEKTRPGFIEVNHCLKGSYECVLPDGRHISLGMQDFSFSDMGRPMERSSFVSGEYCGLSLLIHVETAEQSLNDFLGEQIPFSDIFERLLYGEGVLILRTDPRIQHIVSELYHAPDGGHSGYYKLKTMELILFLAFHCDNKSAPAHPCYCRNSARKVEDIARKMTENLKRRYTLSELAAKYHISMTTLKTRFAEVYGETPYQYLKRRRLERAALLLKTTDMSVGEVAETVGYQNPSKFSSAFTDYYGTVPREYKKDAVLEQSIPFGAGANGNG
ncbi:helix-turn-helix transcriptional regulator [Christensenella tenuis]|uniref:Helix-turn-helix transcriptional regulator n=1 Tax=Christensenella tenuis TaxID=2763033 RepID=A0ABR7EGS4_9FIRM|nr:AraC family transcriptional regulator [Christensenella tenuis]MBC5648878.1 helix-turn-helix transcriptional regulator [Christensenella tenuis]